MPSVLNWGKRSRTSAEVRTSGGMFSRLSRTGFGEGDRLAVEIRGHDLNIVQDLAGRVRSTMMAVPGVGHTETSLQPGMPEMLVQVDRTKAASMGVNEHDLARTIETAVGGQRASMFRQSGDESMFWSGFANRIA